MHRATARANVSREPMGSILVGFEVENPGRWRLLPLPDGHGLVKGFGRQGGNWIKIGTGGLCSMRASIRILAGFVALTLAVPVTFADNKEKDPDQIGNRDVGKGVNFYSIEKEIALGKQMAQEVERQARIVDDPVVAEYVNRIGQNLVRNSDAKVPFTIKVIDSEEINAFALPGGFFFVNTGILLNADNEAEMAGVMGHEIAHVAARHGTRQATRGQIAQIGSIVPL